jgi:hypothetical protein
MGQYLDHNDQTIPVIYCAPPNHASFFNRYFLPFSKYRLVHDTGLPKIVKKDFYGKCISERNCLKHLSNQMFHANPNCCAKSLITPPPKHISPETDLFTAASTMFSHHENYLPVIENEKLIGIISLQSILRGLNDYRNQITQATTKSKFPPDIHKVANHRFIVGPS